MTPEFPWDWIPVSLKRRVATSAVNSLVRNGDSLVHDWLGIPSLKRTIGQLIQSGWSPSQFVDVGAFEGEWSENLLGYFPKAHYLLVEAQPSKCEFLKKSTTGRETARL